MQHFCEGVALRNLLLTISYDGKYFHGWQIQQNAYTVQEALQNALSKIIGEDFDVKGCSRTDSGVHANKYCVSVKTAHPIPPERLKAALNRWLPLSVAVLDCREVDLDFHARYSCKSKEYIYKIWNSEVRSPFLDGYACTTAIRLTPGSSTRRLRRMSENTTLPHFALSTTESRGT